nr:hypothetical protein [Endozoicomonas sp.]
MDIRVSSAHSAAQPATYPTNKKQQTAKQKHVSICQPEASLTKELQALNRLKIATSTIRCTTGVGSGLFSTANVSVCNTPDKLIFKKRDIILEGITGILAFSHQYPETRKHLEWLYYDGLCMPLGSDSHILWSPYRVNDLGLGVMPDGPVIYMNDSTNPNCKVNVGVKRKFDETEGLTLKCFPNREIPIEFKIEASKAIPPATELLWCYRSEAKRTMKSGKRSSSVNFKAQYLKKSHTPDDHQTIKDKTTTAFSDSDKVSVTITTDFNDILRQRLKNRETSVKRELKYDAAEKTIIQKISGNTITTNKLLNKSEKNALALKTYVKYQLNRCDSVLDAIKTIKLSFNRNNRHK